MRVLVVLRGTERLNPTRLFFLLSCLLCSVPNPSSQDPWRIVRSGFFSPAGYDCQFRCIEGAYCDLSINERIEITGTEAEVEAYPECTNRRQTDQTIAFDRGLFPNASDFTEVNITSYCCSASKLAPLRPASAVFPTQRSFWWYFLLWRSRQLPPPPYQ